MGLKEYQTKRDFSRTREPAGQVRARSRTRQPIFVVQKHAASHLHYDFRLEMDGVLKSWAVPKGFPLRRGERRLAVQVEDHPLEYGGFEGTIPEGNYGAGTVMVWDTGTYEMRGAEPARALHAGKLPFTLKGKKLKGDWTLVRLRRAEEETKPPWLLLKSGEDLPPIPDRAEDRSVLTGRSLDQIGSARKKKEWQSNRASARANRPPKLGTSRSRVRPAGSALAEPTEPPSLVTAVTEVNLCRLPTAKPGFVAPMKALMVDQLPAGPEWIYEVKFDGVRALAIKNKGSLSLVSRAAKDLGAKYAPILEALRGLPAAKAVLDGEVVAVDPQGRSSFQLLQSYQSASGPKPPLFYYVFDLVNLDGKDLTGLPLWQRKAMAQALLADLGPTIRFSASIQADSERVRREMQARGLEGLLAKQKHSKYEGGQRSGAWAKFKWTNEQEFVIGGYTEPKGGRTHFGAILVGYYEADQLRFAAKVGTGFNHELLASLFQKFKKLTRSECPFANLPENLPGSSKGLTAAQMRSCTWLEPKLVCQVRFAEWTRDHHLRQPAFLGLREDKEPKEVVREQPR